MLFSTREAAQVLLILTIISRYLGAFFACFSLPCLLCCQFFIATISASVHIHTNTHKFHATALGILLYFLPFFLCNSSYQLVLSAMFRCTQTHTRSSSFYSFSSSLPDNSTFFVLLPISFTSAQTPNQTDTHGHRQLLQPLWQLEREDDTQPRDSRRYVGERERKVCSCVLPSHHRLPACLPGLAKFLCEQMLPNWFYCRPHRERRRAELLVAALKATLFLGHSLHSNPRIYSQRLTTTTQKALSRVC